MRPIATIGPESPREKAVIFEWVDAEGRKYKGKLILTGGHQPRIKLEAPEGLEVELIKRKKPPAK